MHVSWGAFEVNVVASVASLLFALLWLAGWLRTRHGYLLLLAAGWAGLCMYWGMIAISAGDDPLISRAQIASAVREELLVSIAFLVAGKLAMLRLMYRGGRE